MTRLVFCDDPDVTIRRSAHSPILSAAGLTATIYTDAAGTTLADVVTYPGGVAYSGSQITVNSDSRLPLFSGPDDSTDTLYATVAGGTITPIYARVDDRLDALEAGGAGGDLRFAEIKTRHISDAGNHYPILLFVCDDPEELRSATDHGTRVYVAPDESPTTGIGGKIDIFIDPYLDDLPYRVALGLLGAVDFGGDYGTQGYGTGIIQAKGTNGSPYTGHSPDIVFGADDLAVFAGRIAYLTDHSTTRQVWVFGSGYAELAPLTANIVAEFRGEAAFSGAQRGIRWAPSPSSVILSDVVTTLSSKTVTSASGAFTTADIGKTVTTTSNTPIPSGTKIKRINSATSIEVTNAAIATTTGTSMTIVNRPPTSAGNKLGFDDSAMTFTLSSVLHTTFDGNGITLADGKKIITGTTTGLMIGSVGGASGQKLGFLGATPIVQAVLATGTGKTVDNVITALQNLGLVRQS